jgi:hypothetical protein
LIGKFAELYPPENLLVVPPEPDPASNPAREVRLSSLAYEETSSFNTLAPPHLTFPGVSIVYQRLVEGGQRDAALTISALCNKYKEALVERSKLDQYILGTKRRRMFGLAKLLENDNDNNAATAAITNPATDGSAQVGRSGSESRLLP